MGLFSANSLLIFNSLSSICRSASVSFLASVSISLIVSLHDAITLYLHVIYNFLLKSKCEIRWIKAQIDEKKARFGGSGLYLLPLGARQRGLPGVAGH
jgi:hypothetical protein